MKRPKKAKVIQNREVYKIYSVVCPHCHTELRGGFDDNVLRRRCSQCKNEIILNWD